MTFAETRNILSRLTNGELGLNRLSFDFHDAKAFSRSPWGPAMLLIIVRFVILTCCAVFLANDLMSPWSPAWLLYLSTWNAILTIIYFLATLISSTVEVVHECKALTEDKGNFQEEYHVSRTLPGRTSTGLDVLEDDDYDDIPTDDDSDNEPFFLESPPEDQLPWYMKCVWLLFTVNTNTSIIVLVFYISTATVYQPILVCFYVSMVIFMMTETAMSLVPVRFLHCIYAYSFIVLYIGIKAVTMTVSDSAALHNRILPCESFFNIYGWRDYSDYQRTGPFNDYLV
ncbi:predicted protein [Nematostella vectensis]|uniref:Uncharacterized protein n=1 Tax=Nematostella vectensis TaxID=45351 RepID=A7RT44_NEMVE|nr:predicted protein [Nematostella vectensis]|eukprot:XP_001637388.1 predicted protein [Nematostella vectensis]